MGLTKPKITGGVELPELSNPAGAANIQSGFEAVDGEGNKITGTHTEASLTDLLPAMSNPAGAANIESGYQGVNSAGQLVTGSAIIAKNFHEIIELSQSTSKTIYHTLGRVTKVVGIISDLRTSKASVSGTLLDNTCSISGASFAVSSSALTLTYSDFKNISGTFVIINDADKATI